MPMEPAGAVRTSLVFLLDVDNTLLDNDRVIGDLRRHLERTVGAEFQAEYWTYFEELRASLGYTDYLGALQRFRLAHPHDPHLLAVSSFLIDYPFAVRLLPESLDVVEWCKRQAPTVILTDGDVVFQPHKIERSGLYDVVDGHVLLYVHKENELADVERRYPADHYVLVDDKLRILTAVKAAWGKRVTTVFPRQGSYAHDVAALRDLPPADIAIERIGELMRFDLNALVRASKDRAKPVSG
ncbi:HAD family hydrolase [Candidatus Binatia bacterium]|nr:HAD family hydrolase [Candidatus Binatia bacterium]